MVLGSFFWFRCVSDLSFEAHRLVVMHFCLIIGLQELDMTTLTVTARGQVTFRKKVMQHLGVKPGEKIELDLLPDGRGVVRAARPTGTIDDFIGMLAGRTTKVATIEEINEAAALGWAGLIDADETKRGGGKKKNKRTRRK